MKVIFMDKYVAVKNRKYVSYENKKKILIAVKNF